MRRFAKLSAALFAGLFAAGANAHIEFIEAKFVSLEPAADHWILKLEIHEWLNGGPKEPTPRPATLHFKRDPRCIRTNNIYLGTPEEYERALAVLREQLAAGGTHTFGFNVTPLHEGRDEYIAVNLRVGKAFDGKPPVVWSVQSEAGYYCFKQLKNSSRG